MVPPVRAVARQCVERRFGSLGACSNLRVPVRAERGPGGRRDRLAGRPYAASLVEGSVEFGHESPLDQDAEDTIGCGIRCQSGGVDVDVGLQRGFVG